MKQAWAILMGGTELKPGGWEQLKREVEVVNQKSTANIKEPSPQLKKRDRHWRGAAGLGKLKKERTGMISWGTASTSCLWGA